MIIKPLVTQYYESDHDRLDELFRAYQQHKRTDHEKAKELFRQFKFGLQRHIVWEEEILFPLFESRSGLTSNGPTYIMRSEHRQIGKHLEAIHEKVNASDPESDYDEQMMLNILELHNQKEEHILYPAIDRLISDEEREKVFKTMEQIPAEMYENYRKP